jgi:hypothetical protein
MPPCGVRPPLSRNGRFGLKKLCRSPTGDCWDPTAPHREAQAIALHHGYDVALDVTAHQGVVHLPVSLRWTSGLRLAGHPTEGCAA